MAKLARQAKNYVMLAKVSVLVLTVAAYSLLPGVQEFITIGITYLKHRNFESLRQFILSFGIWAPVTSIALMALQSMVPLVPGVIITITNAWIFGWQHGALYSWTGALLGAVIDFGIARWYGRPIVEQFINPKYLTWSDAFFKRHGVMAVFITRITPIIPFKVISYGAGLTAISLVEYAVATAIGQTPAIILYSILGQNLVHNIKSAVLITSLLIIAGLIVYYYRDSIERYFVK